MKRQQPLLLLLLGLLASLSSVNGQITFSAGGLPSAIPDPGNLNNIITVSGLPGTVATADEVQINVAIAHAWASDIIIGVTPPGGSEIIIVNRIGGGVNIDMASGNVLSFRSNAAAVVAVPGLNGVIPAGIYLPSGANAVGSFSSLIGATRNGSWTIRVRDDDSIVQGSLQSASITFFGVGSACPNPPTASVSTQPTCAVTTGTVTVTAPANGSGVSYTITGTSPVVAAATNATGVFSGLAPGTYEVVSIVSGCTSPAATLVVNAAPSPTTYYADVDQDGFGNPANTIQACSQPSGFVTNNTDCNDLSAVEKPGQVWYKDTDGDGYAQTATATITQCARPVGYKAASELTNTTGDCNDNNAAIKPGATEICDGLDNDCDEEVDEGVQTPFFLDADGDGYYTGSPILACSSPGINYVTSVIGGNDCNDNNPIEKPGQVWYKDTDGDGYAQTGAATITQCARPVGYKVASELTNTTGDCNDNNAAIKPGATEICDGLDNNCNGSIDDGLPFVTYYTDADGDGYGTGVGQSLCANPGQGFATQAGDCNDNNAAIKPGATEICDGLDNNCNGSIDEPSPVGSPWSSGDVGAPGVNGSATNSCSMASNVLNISATGFSMPSSDKMHFVYQQLCGNGSITARVANVTGGGWAGVMMRESLSPGAKKAVLKTQLSNFIRRELRTTTNGATSSLNFNRPVHQWLQLTRSGNVVTGFTSPDGTNWDFAFSATISMGSCIQVGVFSESINVNAVTTASFATVTVTGTTPLLAEITDNNFNGVDQVLSDINITLAPNPTQGLVNVQFQAAPTVPMTIEVFNLLGERISRMANQNLDGASIQLDLSNQAAGVYFVHISAEGTTPVVKRVVLADK